MPYTDGAKTLKIRVVAIGEKNENVTKQDDKKIGTGIDLEDQGKAMNVHIHDINLSI